MNELALFAGAGGGILGGQLLGWHTVGAVEIEKYPREILLQRQKDGILPFFPIWDDVTTFNGKPWKGCIDIISGGFPCQDISTAGKGAGINGERSGLWGEMSRIIDEVRPEFALVENSPALTIRGLGRVLGDLAEMGYDARWCVLGADDAGAPHRRKRIWILAYAGECEPDRLSGEQRKEILQTRGSCKNTYWETDPADIPNTNESNDSEQTGKRKTKGKRTRGAKLIGIYGGETRNRPTKPAMGRVAHGVAHRVDRLKAIGNGQVPGVAATAFVILSEGLI